MTNNLTRTKYLELQLVLLIWTPPANVAPLLSVDNAPKTNVRYHNKNSKSQTLFIYQASKKMIAWKMKLRMAHLRSATMHMYLLSKLQQSTISVCQVFMMVGVPSNPNWDLKKPNRMYTLSGALPTSNMIDYVQLPRDIHEMSSNDAHP